jgi:hypothetical protein
MGSFSTYWKEYLATGPTETEADTKGLPSKEVFCFNHPKASRVSFSKQVKVEKITGQYDLNLPERLSEGNVGLVTSVGKGSL